MMATCAVLLPQFVWYMVRKNWAIAHNQIVLMHTQSVPRFNTVADQLKILLELLTHVRVGNELKIHLASITGGEKGNDSHPFTRETVVIPGMDRRLINVFELAMRQYGIHVDLPQLGVHPSDSAVVHQAGAPRVVAVNLIAHRHHDEEHPVDLAALIARKDSYLSAIATLWMIALNPDYARWLVEEQGEYRHILLPGLTNRDFPNTPEEEELVLRLDLTTRGMALRWFAPAFTPLGSVSPVVVTDDHSPHLVARLVTGDDHPDEE